MRKRSIVFVMCTLLLSVLILSNERSAYANDSDYEWDDNKDGAGNPDGTVTITEYVGTSKDVVIPDTLGGKSVTGIGVFAFDSKDLTSVTLPDSLTSIGVAAFNLNNLTSVTLPDSLTSIGDYAFSENNLTSVTLPDSLKSIGVAAFYSNPLMSVTLTSTIHSMPYSVLSPRKAGHVFDGWYTDSAFTIEWDKEPADVTLYAKWTIADYTWTDNLDGETVTITSYEGTSKDVVIPDTLGGKTITRIGPMAFRNTSNNLTSVTLPDSLTSIGSYAFSDNDLTSVTLPDSLKRIESYAFAGNNLTSVVLPDSLTIIDAYAFYSNPLMSVTLTSNVNVIQSNALSSPWKIGHVFDGWYTDSTFTIEWDKAPADVTLYAKWIVNKYTITFDSQEGTLIQDIVADYATQISVPTEPTKLGHTFVDWYTDMTFATPWDFLVDTVQENMTLYAKWAVNEYTITFDSQGGSAVLDVEADYDTRIIAPTDPTKSGYTFVGWYTDTIFTTPWDFAVDTVQGDMTLHAKWQYKVTFDSNDGSTVGDAFVDPNALLIPPSSPTKSAHTFSGWYKDMALTMPWDFSVDTVKEDTTLYAKWQHKVMFESTSGSAVENVLVDSNALLSPPSIPIQSGHTFVGWYTDTTFTTPWNFAVDTVQENMTLYAKWTVNEYTITFDSQGGSAVQDVVTDYGTLISAPTLPTKSGHTFTGWYTDTTFTTPWNFSMDTVQGNQMLYAKWKPRLTPPLLDIQATMTVDKALTEEQLDGGTIIVDVSDTNFIMSLIPEYFKLQNAPKGLTIRKVKRISAWQVELTLAFDGKHLEQNYDLGLMIHGAALTNGFNITTNNSLRIQKGEIPYKIITKEGTFEPTKVWAVKLSNEVDASTIQDALYIVDVEGNRIPATFTSEGRNIYIQPPTGNYEEGTYTLYISSKLKNKNGTNLKEPIKMTFIIETIEEPEQEEAYKTIIEEGTFLIDKAWTIDLVMDIDPATLENGVFMEDENGTIIPVTFTSDGINLIVQAPVEGYEAGTYRLYITSEIKDTNGTNLKEPIQMIFTVG